MEEFKKSGYHVKYQILNASHFGVPQKRERVFIVGFRNERAFERFSFPDPVTFEKPTPISSIVIPEKQIEERFYFSERAVQGMKNTKHAKTMNKGRAQRIGEPCNTVGAHLAKVSLNSTDPVLCINGKYRMFTPREVARIQSFPENFEHTYPF